MPETAVMLLVNVKRRKKKVSLRNDVTVTNRDEKFAEVRPLANILHKGPTVNGPRETRNPRISGDAPKLIDPSMIAAQVDAYVRAYVEGFVFKTIALRPSRSPRYLRRGSEYLCIFGDGVYQKYDSVKRHFIRKHLREILNAGEPFE